MEYVDKYQSLVDILAENVEIDGKQYKLSEEFDKFFVHGNKSAGVRIRKIMQIARKKFEEIRIDVQNYKKNIYG